MEKNKEKIQEPMYIPNREFLNYVNRKIFFNNLEIEKDNIKAQNRAEVQYTLAQRKIILREAERELKKAQYDKISLNDDGLVTVTTENSLLKPQPRQLSNFKWPKLTKFTPIDDETLCIYLFHCEIDGTISEVFLDGRKTGSHTYLRKKLTSIGCQFFLDAKVNEKKYILSLWSILLKNYCKEQTLPRTFGWYKFNEKILFCKKGEFSWETLQEKL